MKNKKFATMGFNSNDFSDWDFSIDDENGHILISVGVTTSRHGYIKLYGVTDDILGKISKMCLDELKKRKEESIK